MKKIGYIICFMVFILAGCSKTIGKNEEVFYNPFIQNLVTYNNQSKEVELWDPADNQLQYPTGEADVYVDGNSQTNEFTLMKIDKSEITELYDFPKNEGVFPIGEKDGTIYFVHSFYQEDGKEYLDKRTLSALDLNTKEVTDYTNAKGLIDYGVVGDEAIYYTVYDDDQDLYSLMKINYSDTSQSPETIKTGLQDGIVLLNGQELYYSDGKKLISDNHEFKKESVNFFYQGSLFQFYLNEEGSLSLKMTNPKDDSVYSEEDIEGIRLEDDQIKICKPGQVINHDL